MSTPNPLIPQGTFQAQAAKGASNVRLAVATIIAIHVVFFGGLLLQGCKRDTQLAQDNPEPTNAEISTNLTLPPIEAVSPYYNNPSNLPPDTSIASPAAPGSNTFATQTPAPTPDSVWQLTNSSSPLGSAVSTEGSVSSATKSYTVVRGDSFSRIASRNGTTVSALRSANPDVDPTRIKPGDKLNVPETAPRSTTALSEGNGTSATAGSSTTAAATYTVKPGDTLTKIAQNHKITISQLRAANNLKTSRVNVGQKLKIPVPNPTQASNGTNLQRAPGL
jgi:LysM repeat protein